MYEPSSFISDAIPMIPSKLLLFSVIIPCELSTNELSYISGDVFIHSLLSYTVDSLYLEHPLSRTSLYLK